MSSFKIDVSGIDNLKKRFAEMGGEAAKQVKAEMEATGFDIVTDAKLLAPVDEGHLRGSISHKVTVSDKIVFLEVIVNTNYAAYLEFGTRKFAAAYVSTLPQEWQTFAAEFKGSGGGSLSEMLVRLQAWVLRKGFAALKTKSGNASKSKGSLKAQEQAAYEIAIQILLNGIKPHPFLYPAAQKNKPLLIERLAKDINK